MGREGSPRAALRRSQSRSERSEHVSLNGPRIVRPFRGQSSPWARNSGWLLTHSPVAACCGKPGLRSGPLRLRLQRLWRRSLNLILCFFFVFLERKDISIQAASAPYSLSKPLTPNVLSPHIACIEISTERVRVHALSAPAPLHCSELRRVWHGPWLSEPPGNGRGQEFVSPRISVSWVCLDEWPGNLPTLKIVAFKSMKRSRPHPVARQGERETGHVRVIAAPVHSPGLSGSLQAGGVLPPARVRSPQPQRRKVGVVAARTQSVMEG